MINLDELIIEECPDDFTVDSLSDTLPVSGFKIVYRLARADDDADVQEYRERRNKEWGDNALDETLHYRAALLLDEIEGVADKTLIQQIVKKLPVQDINYLRNLVNEPPFGLDTEVDMLCPVCFNEFHTELPWDTSFFFPRRKKSSLRA